MALLRTRAPVFLRVNAARATVEEAADALAGEGIVAVPHRLSPTALEVTENARRLKASSAFREGLVELQDVASQAAVDMLLPLAPGARVLDYCAGGGGKALALAAQGARVTAHDADPRRMADLPERARRAGVRIDVAERLGRERFDLVMVDAPCSGSGAWRRQPEAKWRLDEGRLAALTMLQGEVLRAAAQQVASGGTLAYATCSLLEEENGAAVAAFLEENSRFARVAERRLTPLDGGDGFYVSRFEDVA
jgi:16S rRNA (cytosine967-C5)-methyltransferase